MAGWPKTPPPPTLPRVSLVVVQWVSPMLAVPSRGLRARDPDAWAFEPKYDGWRALVHVADGRAEVWSRNRRRLTAAFPELEVAPSALRNRSAILDAELVCFAPDGRPCWHTLRARAARRAARRVDVAARFAPATLVVFDVPMLDGEPTMRAPYVKRRALLEQLDLAERWRLTPAGIGPDAGALVLEHTRRHRLEGLVAKRVDAPYSPGRRSEAWRKIKHPWARDAERGA